jgi:hypothetical protein
VKKIQANVLDEDKIPLGIVRRSSEKDNTSNMEVASEQTAKQIIKRKRSNESSSAFRCWWQGA